MQRVKTFADEHENGNHDGNVDIELIKYRDILIALFIWPLSFCMTRLEIRLGWCGARML